MTKTFILVAGIAVAGLLAAAAMQPATFRVERTTTVAASADKVYVLINDLGNSIAGIPTHEGIRQ